MQDLCEKLKAHFPNLNCAPSDSVTFLIESQNIIKNAVSSYIVSFSQKGVVISNFDKLSPGALGTRCCVDNIIVNGQKTIYVELKNGINSNLSEIGSKFYYAYLKSSPILAVASLNEKNLQFVVVYTNEKFITPSCYPEDSSKKKQLTKLKDHIKAWHKDSVLLPYQINDLSSTNELKITKMKYNGTASNSIPIDKL